MRLPSSKMQMPPVIMAVTFVTACLVILFNLIADLLYGWLDPRISYR